MKKSLSNVAFAGLIAFAGSANAEIIVDSLLGNDRANLNTAGQTFTVNGLGGETGLASIDVEGPLDHVREDLVAVEIWTDTDGDHATWDPGTLLGTSTTAQLFLSEVSSFYFHNVEFSENTVYALLFTNEEGGEGVISRFGLNNATALSDGTLFQQGETVFGDAYDAALQIKTSVYIEQRPGDFNLDGTADLLDYQIWIDNYRLAEGVSFELGDANYDSKIDIDDFILLRGAVLADTGVDLYSIPEPGSLVMIGVSGLVMFKRRSK